MNFRSHSKDFYSANSVQKSDDTNRASTISKTAPYAENVHALAKTSMDIMPIWMENWIWKRISIIVKKLINCFVIYVSLRFTFIHYLSSGKSSNSEGFWDNEHFDMSTKCFYPSSEHYDKFNTTGTNNEIQVWDEIFMPIMEFHTLLCNQLK